MNQSRLRDFGMDAELDLSILTPAERWAYVAVRLNGACVREFAQSTDRSPGTVGVLLRRAEEKMGERRG